MKKKLIIGKEEISIDTEIVAGISGDLSGEMDRIASEIATYGAYLAAAKKQQLEQKAQYRHWKAKYKEALFKKDPKFADTKATNAAEADPTFLEYKKQEAACLENVEFLDKLVDALKEKSPNLRSRGAWERREYGSHNMNTRENIDDAKVRYRGKVGGKQPRVKG